MTYKATPDEKYGYEANADAAADRPAVVEQPVGSGHSVLFGFNPFYRSWKEQDERLVLNAALYPKGGVVAGAAPTPDTAAPAPQAAAIEPVAAPVKGQAAGGRGPRAGAKAHASRPRRADHRSSARDGAKLKAAVRAGEPEHVGQAQACATRRPRPRSRCRQGRPHVGRARPQGRGCRASSAGSTAARSRPISALV